MNNQFKEIQENYLGVKDIFKDHIKMLNYYQLDGEM